MQLRFYAVVHLDLTDRNAVALEAVETNSTPVYSTPRLSTGHGSRIAEGESAPDPEHRRSRIGGLNEQLSRYYALLNGHLEWKCPELSSRGKHNRGRLVRRHLTYLDSFSVARCRAFSEATCNATGSSA